jgi:DNA-binding MarR family transcriptional regulator
LTVSQPPRSTVTELYDFVAVAMRALSHDRDLSLTSAATLATLNRRGPQRITTLAAAEGISQPSMTQLVQRLQARGLVARTPDPDDARATLVGITDAGRAAVRERRRESEGRLADLLAELPEADVAALATAVAAVLPALRANAGTRLQHA